MSSTDNTGLGLFDDAASAVGNFPSALRGYDRSAVDEYVRGLEASTVAGPAPGRRARTSERRPRPTARGAVKQHGTSDADYTNLGGRASEILRLAEEQARDVMDRATVDAERTKEEARREADATRKSAAREGNDAQVRRPGRAGEGPRAAGGRRGDPSRARPSRVRSPAWVPPAGRPSRCVARPSMTPSRYASRAYLDTEELAAHRRTRDRRHPAADRRRARAGGRAAAPDPGGGRAADVDDAGEATEYHEQSAARLEADIKRPRGCAPTPWPRPSR